MAEKLISSKPFYLVPYWIYFCCMEVLIKLWFNTGIQQQGSASDGRAAGYFSTFCMWRLLGFLASKLQLFYCLEVSRKGSSSERFSTLSKKKVAIVSWSAWHYPGNLLPIVGTLLDHFLEVHIKFLDTVCNGWSS